MEEIRDCIQCPFCLVKKKSKTKADIICSSLDRSVGIVDINKVLSNKAEFTSPEDCLLRKKTKMKVTPEYITSLNENEIFVFGSNLQGQHMGGAAYVAYNNFGAQWGNGIGIQGQSYAIPTMHGGVDVIKPHVDDFIDYARKHPENFFYITPIGCGIAGFTPEEIAPLFKEALNLDNVAMPQSFLDCLQA